MIPLVETNRLAIADLCRHYGVRKLALFGSAATCLLDPVSSDLALAFECADYGLGAGRRFLRFAVELEDLWGRSVDLVFGSVMTGPGFRDSVISTQVLLHDAATSTQAMA